MHWQRLGLSGKKLIQSRQKDVNAVLGCVKVVLGDGPQTEQVHRLDEARPVLQPAMLPLVLQNGQTELEDPVEHLAAAPRVDAQLEIGFGRERRHQRRRQLGVHRQLLAGVGVRETASGRALQQRQLGAHAQHQPAEVGRERVHHVETGQLGQAAHAQDAAGPRVRQLACGDERGVRHVQRLLQHAPLGARHGAPGVRQRVDERAVVPQALALDVAVRTAVAFYVLQLAVAVHWLGLVR